MLESTARKFAMKKLRSPMLRDYAVFYNLLEGRSDVEMLVFPNQKSIIVNLNAEEDGARLIKFMY